MATLVVSPRNSLRQVRSSSSTRSLDEARSKKLSNRHLPYCPPGAPRSRSRTPVTPPASPPDIKISDDTVLSLLHPADAYNKIHADHNIYGLDAATLYKAVTHMASSALPDPSNVFPWLHGLHPENEMQLAFFLARRKAMRNAPQCMRGIAILKAGGDLTKSRLKGAVAPEEVLAAQAEHQTFYDMDPREGFSVRSFHIQVSKMALVSDIVVYKDEQTPTKDLQDLALRCAGAQHWYREKCKKDGYELPEFNTFVVMSPFNHFERQFPDIVAIDSKGEQTGNVMDFHLREKYEMCTMSKASEISCNVWIGPSPDSTEGRKANFLDGAMDFDVLIEANDSASLPTGEKLRDVARKSADEAQKMDFPSSGSIMPPSWNHAEVDALLATVTWIHQGANANVSRDHVSDTEDDSDDDDDDIRPDADGDIPMDSLGRRKPGCRFLIHCTDGYTESSLLGLAYLMYAECLTAHDAWLKMHTVHKRNFFAYLSDVNLLSAIEPRLMQVSPKRQGTGIPSSVPSPPQWFKRIDGSLPSRVTPYMYLGNLNHANNPELLELLGVDRVLSVGEPISWAAKRKEQWGRENLMYVDNLQDNGVDPLTGELDRCLEFIERGRREGKATLVHCRVGVSRSATICIAEVMRSMRLSLPRAYCFVRARRLNVIIQPHLRFTYELLKWEEEMQIRNGKPVQRELEWAHIAREIAAMNKPYTRGG